MGPDGSVKWPKESIIIIAKGKPYTSHQNDSFMAIKVIEKVPFV